MPEHSPGSSVPPATEQITIGARDPMPVRDPDLLVQTPFLSLAATLVPWDTESFGVPVAQVQDIEVRDRVVAYSDLQLLLDWFGTHGVDLAACRLPHARLLESSALEHVGFRFIEMVYSMRFEIHRTRPEVGENRVVQWRRAGEADRAQLQQMAVDAFATGRWNVDWSVGQQLGGRRYADWVGRSLSDPRHQVMCALVDGQPAGLFIVEPGKDGSMYWHLTAVAPQWQGKGIGKAMWGSMLHRHSMEGATSVQTTISARNVPVVNLYARLGWRFEECQMTYHWASARWLAKQGRKAG